MYVSLSYNIIFSRDHLGFNSIEMHDGASLTLPGHTEFC